MLFCISTFPTAINAQHFNFPGGSFTGPQWSIFIGGATLNGEDLVPGDEIAVFDGEIMVGAYVLTQVCTQENQLENKLTAFAVLLDRALGYTAGNPITFKCWKASPGLELKDWTADWLDPYGDAWTQEIFPAGPNNYSLPVLSFSHIFTGNISGMVTNATSGAAIAGAEVKIIETGETFTTTADGGFQFMDIPVGAYTLTASSIDFVTDTISEVQVVSDQTATVNFTLTKIFGNISGQVKNNQDNLPIEGALVKMIETGEAFTTTADGVFGFVDVLTGNYTLTAFAGGFFADTIWDVEVFSDQSTEIDFELTKILATLAGTVTNKAGELLEGVSISVEGHPHTTQTLADGSYSIEQIPQGTYEIAASAEGYFTEISDGIALTNNETTILNFTLTGSTQHTIALRKGYSLVSSYIMPDEPDMMAVMGALLNNLEFARNDQGNTLIKIGPNWVNGIGNWSPAEGYLFKMATADSITLHGSSSNNPPVMLNQGYNIIPFTLHHPKNAMEVFEGSLDKLTFVRNNDGFQMLKIGSNWVNLIGDMKPGEGYLVKMNQADTLYQKPFECGDLLFDTRDGQQYKTVKIGEQCWMAENLAYLPEVSPSSQGSENNPFYYVYDYQGTNVIEAKATTNYQTYGVLYNWPASLDACPEGWHLPADAEWTTLTDYVSSQPEYLCNSNTSYIAKALAATTNWNSYSGTCAVGNNLAANNATGFSGLPGGFRGSNGSFGIVGYTGYFWSSTEYSATYAWPRLLDYSNADVSRSDATKGYGISARCLRDENNPANQPPIPPSNPQPENGSTTISNDTSLSWSCSDPDNDPLTYDVYFGTEPTPPQVATGIADTFYTPGTLEYATTYYWQIVAHDDHGNSTEGEVWSFTTVDDPWQCGDLLVDERDGQSYETVQIGEQCWMAENLNVGERIDGAVEMTDNGTIEKYCYDNDPAKCDIYGGLYQWDETMQYVTLKGVRGICPIGWHIPTNMEWTLLTNLLGGEAIAGGKLKSLRTFPDPHPRWDSPNVGATDEVGFNALPGGNNNFGNFEFIGMMGKWWSSTEYYENNAYSRTGCSYCTDLWAVQSPKIYARSLRCLEGITPENQPPNMPAEPFPENSSNSQQPDILLRWACTDPENNPLTYDVYFGTEATPPQVTIGIADTFYTPGTLEYATTYYWQIVAHDDYENATIGEVWSFTTMEEPEPNVYSLNFSSGQYVRIPISESLSDFQQVTLECWYYQINIDGGDETIIGSEHIGGSPTTMIYFQNDWGQFEGRICDGLGNCVEYADGRNIQQNTWYHLALCFDGSLFKVFINGALMYTEEGTLEQMINDGEDWVINRHTWDGGSSSRLTGYIDELRISNNCRYTESFYLQDVEFIPDEHTMGLWHFNEGTGNQVLDVSGNNNHGNIIGCSWSTDIPF